MSQGTDDKKSVYDSYFTRSMKTITPTVKPVEEASVKLEDATNSAASINNVTNYTTDSLSTELNRVQKELIQGFLSLTLVSNNIEDTMIVVDKKGVETQESLGRRNAVLEKLKQALEDNKSLKNRILELYPEITLDIKAELGDDYSEYMSAVSKLIKLCGSVNSIRVIHDAEGYYPDDDSFDIYNVVRFGDEEDPVVYVPAEQIKESEIKTDKDMLDFISDTLDHPSFISATLIEKRYLRRKITGLRDFASEYEVDEDVMAKVEKVSTDTLTTGTIEKYSGHIKPNDRER